MAELTIKPYLQAVAIGQGINVVLLDGGVNEIIEDPKTHEKKTTFEIRVQLPNKEIRTWTMNKRSQGRVAEAFGFSPAKWVGKVIPVYTVQQEMFGDTKLVIYAKKLSEWPPEIKKVNGLSP